MWSQPLNSSHKGAERKNLLLEGQSGNEKLKCDAGIPGERLSRVTLLVSRCQSGAPVPLAAAQAPVLKSKGRIEKLSHDNSEQLNMLVSLQWASQSVWGWSGRGMEAGETDGSQDKSVYIVSNPMSY